MPLNYTLQVFVSFFVCFLQWTLMVVSPWWFLGVVQPMVRCIALPVLSLQLVEFLSAALSPQKSLLISRNEKLLLEGVMLD